MLAGCVAVGSVNELFAVKGYQGSALGFPFPSSAEGLTTFDLREAFPLRTESPDDAGSERGRRSASLFLPNVSHTS